VTDYRQTAALALAKCAAYDPWFPKASQAIVESWSEQLERHKLELADVLAGVAKMYSENGSWVPAAAEGFDRRLEVGAA
jgi:hypothetical protein